MHRRRLTAARVRTVFAWAGGVFILAQLAASVAFDNLGLTIRFPELDRRFAALRQETRPPDVVYLGSSRFMTCLNSRELTRTLRAETGRDDLSAFALAVTKGDFVVMERILRALRSENRVPPLLVMETNPISVAWGNRWHDVHINRQLLWQDVPEHGVEFLRSGQLGRFLMARFLPLYTYRHTVADYAWGTWSGPLWNEGIDDLDDAAIARLLDPERLITDDESAKAAGGVDIVRRDLRTYRIGGVNVLALERTLTQCRELGVRVVLVGSPVSSFHRREIRPEIEAAYREYLRSIHERFGVPFVDCSAALPDSLFRDHHHTSALGGEVFSRLLARDVLAPLFRPAQPQTPLPTRLVNFPRPRPTP